MAFRFRKSVKLFPGVRMNLSKSGASVSLGAPGATLNLSKRGALATFGVPGTGLSYSMPVFRPQSRREQAGGDRSPITSTTQLVNALHDPRSTVVYSGSGRRLSAQQLSAAYRRLAQAEARERAQAEIDRMESELERVIESWKDMPFVPDSTSS